MMSRLVGDELGRCYHREGVNHLEKCGKLRGRFLDLNSWVLEGVKADYECPDKYFELLKDRKVKGYLGEEKNYFSKPAENSS